MSGSGHVARDRSRGGMAFTATQREVALNKTAQMLVRGFKHKDIAAELGVSTETIRKYTKIVDARWRSAAMMDLDKVRAKELARLDHLEATYWEAYEDSKRSGKLLTETRSPRSNGVDRVETMTTTEQRDGNPFFLGGVMKCIELRCKIYGLEADKFMIFAEVKAHGHDDLTIRLKKYATVLGLSDGDQEAANADRYGLGKPVDSLRSAPEASTVLDTTGFVRERAD